MKIYLAQFFLLLAFKNRENRGCAMAPRAEALAIKLDNMGSTPRTHVTEGTNSHRLSSGYHMWPYMAMQTNKHVHSLNKYNFFK